MLAARSKLTEAALRLLQLAQVPLAGTISYDILGFRAGVPVNQLKTVMRMAMTSNLFFELEPGEVSHTATSALLVKTQGLHDLAVVMTNTATPMANKLVEATEKWPEAVQKNETAYNVAFETDLPFFNISTLILRGSKNLRATRSIYSRAKARRYTM